MGAQTVLLLIPPLTQLNTPYPSTAYLTGFLRSRGIACEQADLGIDMVLRLFSRRGLETLFETIRPEADALPDEAIRMLADEDAYLDHVDAVVAFLQGRSPRTAASLVRPGVLPQGPRFRDKLKFPRSVSLEDRARRRATLFLEDLADLVQATVSPHFALSRYAEHLARSTSSFSGIIAALNEPPTMTDAFMLDSLWAHIDRIEPTLIGLSVPFPGNLYGAFRIAQAVKQRRPDLPIALGGGYANTELRRISDPRVFHYVDFITLDDGERPLLALVEHLAGDRPRTALCRTFHLENGRVMFADDRAQSNFAMDDVGCPTYRGLELDRYLTILDSTNPMHRLWSEGHWNKLSVAHGCYWKQCTFCDVGLDYIARYEQTPPHRLIQQIEQLIEETGRHDFHFVDEAAPPAALKALALGLLERDIAIRWWGNIRFEEAFTPDLCRLLAASGCIAVTAGLEAASDRLLDKMKKGITVDQTARVAAAFQDAGVLVHAYLMYGFPSETIQETVDSLERVRQLFAADLMQSAFWHRFTVTAHSPIGLNPSANGVRIVGPRFAGFADNDLQHRDRGGSTPDWLGEGLRRSMLNYLEGRGLALDVRSWFDHRVPKPRVAPKWIARVLNGKTLPDDPLAERRLVWLGKMETHCVRIRRSDQGDAIRNSHWLIQVIDQARLCADRATPYPLLRDVRASFPGGEAQFEAFLSGPAWTGARTAGLLLI